MCFGASASNETETERYIREDKESKKKQQRCNHNWVDDGENPSWATWHNTKCTKCGKTNHDSW